MSIHAALCVVLLFCQVQADQAAEQRTQQAKVFVALLAAGEFEKASDSFNGTMRKGLPPDKLKQVWQTIEGQFGKFKQTGDIRLETDGKFQSVFVTTEFERGTLATKVVFDAENKIAGLFFVPAGTYKPPGYVNAAAFAEVDISVGKRWLTLPGTLSIPKGDGPFPAVVLVHGSGPHDRDETIGPNKPFRDLAQGLASKGIAVLRYEKRTKHYPLVMSFSGGSITVKEETIDDAADAVSVLAAHEKIDQRRIFVLGHSLGGMLIPRIAKASDASAGFISLAGSARPLEDLILEQSKYLASLDGTVDQEEQQRIAELERQIARVKSPDLSAETPAQELPLGVPAKYWLDLRGYDPPTLAKDIAKPMLILQGERDYQVTREDFGRWQAALGSRTDVSFISYPALNHLFLDGKGKSAPAEYGNPGNVAEAVIKDIAAWITGLSAK